VKEFWVSSGHHLTHRTETGGLAVTDELLLVYLARPEVMPPPEACAAERALHTSLMSAPRREVAEIEIDGIKDPDARENWRFLLRFRDRLIAHASIEAAYSDFAKNGAKETPPIFLSQLSHLVLRNVLDGCEDTRVLRAGELFFRAQRASLQDDRLLLADAEIIEDLEADPHVSPLTAMLGRERVTELDVLTDENAYDYWSRSDAFSMVLDFTATASRLAFADVTARWVAHFSGFEVNVSPIQEIRDQDWRWFVGLDAEGTRLGNALWKGEKLPKSLAERAVALFRLDFPSDAPVIDRVRGAPVYLILGMGEDRTIRMKPQNLVAGLPLAGGSS
jgi:hypothetical protein